MFIDAIAIFNFLNQIDFTQSLELSANIGISNPHQGKVPFFSCFNNQIFDFFTAELALISFYNKQCMEDIYHNISGISGLQQSCGEAEFSDQLALFKFGWFFIFP